MEEAGIKWKDKVRNFEDLLPTTKINHKIIHIDPTILFSRLTALANFKENIVDNFSYGLTPERTSLFKHVLIWKPNKATLKTHFATKEKAIVPIEFDIYVVDGGALLHNVKWPKTTYAEVLDRYENYMNRRYSKFANVMVVFDGYSDELSTKVQEHAFRCGSSSVDIQIISSTKVTTSREAFLANPHNKFQLIKMRSGRLQAIGFMTEQSKGDADTLIVKSAITYAQDGRSSITMAEDTDILVLLMNHWTEGMGSMVLGTDIKENKKRFKTFFWCKSELIQSTTQQETLLFAHAWPGCDTTSAI